MGSHIVSSGTYERFYTVTAVQYHHIIDPKTLMPSAYYSQVTILCRDSGLGDALSTALFNMPLAEGKKLVEGLPGVEVAWVMREGVIEFSSGFHDFINSGDE
jgi:thiamine biosynthesis lipoprotein